MGEKCAEVKTRKCVTKKTTNFQFLNERCFENDLGISGLQISAEALRHYFVQFGGFVAAGFTNGLRCFVQRAKVFCTSRGLGGLR